MSAVCATLQVARSNVAEQAAGRPIKRAGRPPLPDKEQAKRLADRSIRPLERIEAVA